MNSVNIKFPCYLWFRVKNLLISALFHVKLLKLLESGVNGNSQHRTEMKGDFVKCWNCFREWIFHSESKEFWIQSNSDGLNTILSNIERTQTSFFKHRMNSNTLILTSNEQTSNIEPKRTSLDLLNYSSNRLDHNFSNIERTWTRSLFGNWTRTPYFLLCMIEHRT